MSNQKQNGSIIAIITMMFLYAMISFVTNLGAPIGVIWKNQPEIGGSNVLGIMGNFMNFFAYLFMGIPAGKMLTKVGYKKDGSHRYCRRILRCAYPVPLRIFWRYSRLLRLSVWCFRQRFRRLYSEHRCQPYAQPLGRWWQSW